MATNGLTMAQAKALHTNQKTRDIVESWNGLQEALSTVDLKTNPSAVFDKDNFRLIENYITAGVEEALNQRFADDEYVFMESMTDSDEEIPVAMETAKAHIQNISQLLENSLTDGRVGSANLRNINELTPLDAFIPLLIVRSYLPLCGKDLMPYVVPKMKFIRFKELQKWIVTKDGTKYRRPDVYSDPDAVEIIINSGKGRKVSDRWYPIGEAVDADAGDGTTYAETVDDEEKNFTIPTDKLSLADLDLLEESGGNRNIGDALSEDVYITSARAVVTSSVDNKQHVVEMDNLGIYYDVTSYTPQRSISATIKYVLHLGEGETATSEEFEDRIYGSYDAEKATFEVVSSRGFTKQIKFGGNLSNKNNMEYFQFSNSFDTHQHVIPEGIRSDFPITYEDQQLYRDTANIDIIATAVAEMNEIFVNLEDTSIVGTVQTCWKRYENKTDHNCYRFQGQRVAWGKEVDLKRDASRHFKNLEYIQDELQYAVSREIAAIRTVCGAEPFKLHMACHPNVASLFVGDHVDWKVSPGASVADNIRSDYYMGIYTANGDSMRVVATQKFREEDGIILLVQPVNEENFMTWKHFKRALYFDKNHRTIQMPNNPNIMGVATFHTHPYIPFQVRILPKNYQ